MNGLPKASAVLMAVATGFTVKPNDAKVAAGIAWARTTPALLGQVMTVPRTVQTNQLLVIREPFVSLELPFVSDKAEVAPVLPLKFKMPGVKPKVTAGPLERVSMSYLFWLNSKPHLIVWLPPTMFCM